MTFAEHLDTRQLIRPLPMLRAKRVRFQSEIPVRLPAESTAVRRERT